MNVVPLMLKEIPNILEWLEWTGLQRNTRIFCTFWNVSFWAWNVLQIPNSNQEMVSQPTRNQDERTSWSGIKKISIWKSRMRTKWLKEISQNFYLDQEMEDLHTCLGKANYQIKWHHFGRLFTEKAYSWAHEPIVIIPSSR